MLDAMTAPGRVDEEAHALLGNRFVQEAVDRAASDLRREQPLVFVAARDHQHQVRELRLQAIAELVDRRGDRRGIENCDARMAVEQVGGEIRFGADTGNVVIGGNATQSLQELRVVREHDEVFGDVGDDVVGRSVHLNDAPEPRCGGDLDQASSLLRRAHCTMTQLADSVPNPCGIL